MVLKSTSLEENRDNAMAVMMNLYKQYYKLWNYQISRVLTSSNNDINDLIHDVFVRLMATHVEKICSLPEPLQIAYISKAMRNAALKYVNAQSHVVVTDQLEQAYANRTAPDPAIILEQKVTFENFKRAYERIPERMRRLLYYKFFEGLPDEEIAKLLDLKPASLRSALHRARVALRIELAKEEQYESSTER